MSHGASRDILKKPSLALINTSQPLKNMSQPFAFDNLTARFLEYLQWAEKDPNEAL